jgi:hypothetical protein
MQGLFKFVQVHETFICNFILALKLTEANLFTCIACSIRGNIALNTSLVCELVKHMHNVLCLAWGKEATFEVNYVFFLWVINLICWSLQIQPRRGVGGRGCQEHA